MEEIIKAFGIDWRLLTIQLINFGLLMFLLYRFLYKPILKLLDERKNKIAKGVHDAEAAERTLGEIERERSVKIVQAEKEADTLIEHARSESALKARQQSAEGEKGAARIMKEAEAQAREIKERAVRESKEEL